MPSPHDDSLAIPAVLLPRDGRFGSGPSKVRHAQVQAIVRGATTVLGTSHRQAPVRSVVARLRSGLRDLFTLPEDYEVVLGNGGTTTFWDVATACLVRHHAHHGVFGEFGAKFAAATSAAPFLTPSTVSQAQPGSVVVPEAITDADVYAWPHNETSTGAMAPVRRPDGIPTDALVLVDATSAAGAMPVDVSQTDVYYFAPQKAFASDGGLWIALCSPQALTRGAHIESAGTGRWIPESLSLTAAVRYSRIDQTANTPAVATLLMLAEQVDWLVSQGGLAWASARSAQSAAHVYGWAEQRDWASPFVAESADRSTVVATIDLAEQIDANRVIDILRAHGILDVFPYRKLGRNQLRIGLFPAVDLADVQALTACIDWVVAHLAH